MTKIVPKIVVVYFSQFHGHTKIMAESVAGGIADAGGAPVMVDVAETVDWDALAAADGVVFGSPTYMGSVAAPFKKFMDDSGAHWMKQAWKDKLAAGFTCSHGLSGDKLNVLIQLAVFAAQHGMTWVNPAQMQEGSAPEHVNRLGSFLGVMAAADSKATGPQPPEGDRRSAFFLGARVTQLAARLR
jgi:NAD(P)H dehydrogenase (quinone)